MNRIDRLNAVLIHLQGKPRVTLDELALRFEVSERTTFRDIRSLIEAGVPIGGDAGTGYFIVEGYHLPPVVFNKNEAAALLMGSKLIRHQADREVVYHFEEAMHKVRAVLRTVDKNFLHSLDEHISVAHFPPAREIFPDSNISIIQNALADQQTLKIHYHSNYKDQMTEREVEPLGLVFYSSRWHLIAFCRLRKDLRDFRCDRISKCTLLTEFFDRSRHPSFAEFLEKMVTGTESAEVWIRISKKVSRYIGSQKYYYGFAEERSVGEAVEMKFYTPELRFFARWLMMFGNEVSIISPDELKDAAETLVSELQQHYLKISSEVNL